MMPTNLTNSFAFTATIFLFFIAPFCGQAQYLKFEFGQDAREVERIVQYLVTDHNRVDSYGNTANSRWSWDSRKYDGQITEVIQCADNAYYVDLGAVVDYCKRYVMGGGKLNKILFQFENVPTSRIKAFYDRQFAGRKVGELYFSESWKECSRVYLASNGFATFETSKVDLKKLPPNARSVVVKKIAAYDLQQQQVQEQDSASH